MNIYEKLSAITMEISTVAKNLKVGEGKASYKAVSEADVLAAVKPIEAKYKVYSYPIDREIVGEDIMTSKSEYNGQIKETARLFMRLKTVYRFVDMEKPESYIDIVTFGDGVDSQDKAPGKAMTYSDKYALLKAYKIQTGDDPDQDASQDLNGMQKGFKKAPKSELVCSECGKPIDERVANYSIDRFMRPLCRDCQREVTDGSKRV